MNVWYAAAEAAPFIKVGGLGDVAGSLPYELQKIGCAVTLCLPMHGGMALPQAPAVKTEGSFIFGDESCAYTLHTWQDRGLNLAVYDIPGYFGRDKVYAYTDDSERFAAFCMAIYTELHTAVTPDILHLNDWHTAPLAMLCNEDKQIHHDPYASTDIIAELDGKKFCRNESQCCVGDAQQTGNMLSQSHKPKTLLTIHAMQYPGNARPSLVRLFHMPAEVLDNSRAGWNGGFGALKAGIAYADGINTVSPTAAKELLQNSLYGELSGFLQQRIGQLRNGAYTGILNRVPDSFGTNLVRNTKLRQRLGLEESQHPLMAIVGRLVPEKGFPWALPVLEKWLKKGVQCVFLGEGHQNIIGAVKQLGERYPKECAVIIGFDTALADEIYAGADMLFMPSQVEPCGISQQIALQRGCIPIVHKTGGLADTVKEGYNGFVFTKWTWEACDKAVGRAVRRFTDIKKWQKLMDHAMNADFSWGSSAKAYLNLYKTLLQEEDGRAETHTAGSVL